MVGCKASVLFPLFIYFQRLLQRLDGLLLGGRITIFKEHFSAFEQDFLQPLREYYPVKGY